METTRPVRRNLSRREQRLQDAARQIVTRSKVPLTAEERRKAERESAEERERWRLAFAARTAAARGVIRRAEMRAQPGDPWIAKACRLVGMEPMFVRPAITMARPGSLTIEVPS